MISDIILVESLFARLTKIAVACLLVPCFTFAIVATVLDESFILIASASYCSLTALFIRFASRTRGGTFLFGVLALFAIDAGRSSNPAELSCLAIKALRVIRGRVLACFAEIAVRAFSIPRNESFLTMFALVISLVGAFSSWAIDTSHFVIRGHHTCVACLAICRARSGCISSGAARNAACFILSSFRRVLPNSAVCAQFYGAIEELPRRTIFAAG
mmetsp:Transcript_21616/g.45087  ORF Transcript_21616/g.45087 Transcript_21616/m.45087 type:complete len:216 (+) Transcript_21616:1015-1662(+)